ncbi:MAG TPA: DinB family protein [Thermoanaerobaculia bacterium]|nr:DinB family protein [Thermoanaerobaculia bacterium]
MTIAQSLLAEFDKEMATTRKLLERVPESKAAWKPHEKSMPLGKLAIHVASLPNWIGRIEQFDVFDPATQKIATTDFTTAAALVEYFDRNVAAAREALGKLDDAKIAKTFTFNRAGKTMFALPRAAAIRTLAMNHHIHHRGQLSVYLRLNDVPLPSMYGPTADEG